jgi:hypothetical protein
MSTVCSPSLHNLFFFADLKPEPAIISTGISSCACAVIDLSPATSPHRLGMIYVTFITCDLLNISIDALLHECHVSNGNL